ncbi:MAG: carbohydrate binding domain-containing protein [Lachnospiraceae bacterium]|nr:carbohydrate binding domain-containing protein [Lachnospiraceae bacterium]
MVKKMKMFAKRACVGIMSAAMMMTAVPALPILAAEEDPVVGFPMDGHDDGYADAYSEEGYSLVWNDEFDEDTLNTDDWLVELHPAGWVNSELQEYVGLENGNIEVKDGILSIKTKATKKADAPEGPANPEVLKGDGFDATNWGGGAGGSAKGSVAYDSGKAVLTIEDSGAENWNFQIQQSNLALEAGHEYEFTVKASSTVARKTEISVLDPANNYAWYGGTTASIGTEEGEIKFNFEMKDTSETIALQINFGLIGGNAEDSSPAVVTLSDVSLKDLSVTSDTVDVKKTYDITSGRISTDDKHEFTYGRFEAKLKVPEGKGYWPAFWLLGDQSIYGQWPRCGEIDVMEIVGDSVDTTQGNIWSGYTSSTTKDNPKKKILGEGEGTFADSWHTFTLDWEPGKVTWYVDGEKMHEVSDWYTGKDANSIITYPAPYDQPFYVILNLAFGGQMGGTPTQETMDDMDNQAYQIDYVRVYQKDPEVYKEMLENCKRPEQVSTFREPDTEGNYIINGTFAEDIDRSEGATGDTNWILYTESDAKNASAEVEDGVIKIDPGVVGDKNHSIQLKQQSIPMYRGWEYELSFDAWADEARTMIVDISGPNNGWTRYYDDTTFDLTTEKQPFTVPFTMEKKTDDNGSLEFNFGNQGSTVPVYITNVKITHKSGELIPEDTSKSVGIDGNYIYNGSFDQGDDRLGYWDIEAAEGSVSVTNEGTRRELKAVITIPEGATEAGPVHISQNELAPIAAGKYEMSFDAYMEEGSSADALTVSVAGKEIKPELTTAKKNYSEKFEVIESLTRDQSNVVFTFDKPGTYYLDNVWLVEDAMIKNGSFSADMASWEPYIDGAADASYVVDSQHGKDYAFEMTVNKTGTMDWQVALNQENILLEKGKFYKVTFAVKSTINRQIVWSFQRNGSVRGDDTWTNYSGDGTTDVGPTWKTVEAVFEMKEDTDDKTRFNISMGAVNGAEINDIHYVYIDDVTLEETEEPVPTTKDITTATVTGLGTKAWTGSEITPVVTVKDGDVTLKKGTDYTVEYKNNKAAGKASVVITGIGDYEGTITKSFLIKKVALKYRAYVQKNNWMAWQTANISGTKASGAAGYADMKKDLRMETIQMQLSGISGSVEYRAYCAKKGWTQWATTADTKTYAGTKGESRRVELIQLKAKGQVATLYDMYFRAYSEKFGWLGWAKSGEKAGTQGYAYKLEAFQVNFVPKGTTFSIKSSKTKSFYDKTKDGANPK